MVGDKYTVNLDTHNCSCRKWLVTGLPCCHSITTTNFLNSTVEDYIPHWFRRSTYEDMYTSIIYPVNGQLLWMRTAYPDVFPPQKRTLPGRPKKKRRLEAWELRKDDTQLRKGGHKKKCSICRQVGHNRKQCPQRPPEVDPSQATEAPPQPTQPTPEI